MHIVNTLRVDLKFGAHNYQSLPFLGATDIVRRAARGDEYGYKMLMDTLAKESIGVHFFSKLLALENPPQDSDWERTMSLIRSAEQCFRGADDDGAKANLKSAVNSFNETHKIFYEYTQSLERGAERSITLIEIAYTVAVMYSMGAAELTFVGQAGIAAGGKAWKGLMTEAAKFAIYDFRGEFKWKEIAKDTLFELAAGLTGGSLATQMRSLVAARIATRNLGSISVNLEKVIVEMVKRRELPEKFLGIQGKIQDHLAQVVIALLYSGFSAAVNQAMADKPMTAQDFICNTLDDLGNDAMQIIGKFFRLI